MSFRHLGTMLLNTIKEMTMKQRSEWKILDHQYFTFEHMGRIYSILDVVNVGKSA